jgi:hypothetical protein
MMLSNIYVPESTIFVIVLSTTMFLNQLLESL